MLTYKDAGVNKEEGYKTVERIKDTVAKTFNSNVLQGIGSFGALYQLGQYKDPVLVSGTDGVGTKLEIALKRKKYSTVGQDCFAMCANDILCHGAKPLFFLDYLACGKLDSLIAAELIEGMAKACEQAKCALIGGETAEMPGFYKPGEYDIAGFCVGVVEKESIITGDKIKSGDVILALPSSGLHSNGYSLVRKLITNYDEEIYGQALGDLLLTPTKIYVQPILEILKEYPIHGMAHITGGGLLENIPRIIPNTLCASIQKSKIQIPFIFNYLHDKGANPDDMWGTFNMGVGFVLVIDRNYKEKIIKALQDFGEEAYEIGEIIKRDEKICLE